MLLLLPEAGRPALSPGHSPPSGDPGPPAGVRTTRLPSPTPRLPTSSPSAPVWLLSTLMATPVPTSSLLGNLRPPSLLQGEVMGTPSSPRGPEAPWLAAGPSPCWHVGAMHESGSRWTEPGCSQCWCEDGKVTCEKVRCEAACSHPIPSKDRGCCPSCTGCFHSGVVRAEGDVFSPPNENCTVCVCLAGNVSCISPECPPGPCQTPPQSDCCTCVPVRCYFHGRWYADGAVFSGGGDECTTCVCQNGEVECSFMPCPELACPREEWRLGPGQCCFTCQEPTPATGCSLDDNGVEFPIGQIWSPGDPCELCICQADGSVSCKRTDCVDSCPHPIRIPGQCCPDCSAGCTYTGRIFYNNETFPSVLDPCLSCIYSPCTLSFTLSPYCCAHFTDEETEAQGSCIEPLCISFRPPLSRFPVSSGRKAGALRSQKCGIQQSCSEPAPANCSSCPGSPTASPSRPVLHLLQLLLRTNLTKMQTLPTSLAEAHGPHSPTLGPTVTFPGEPGASPRLSPGFPRGFSATSCDSRALLLSLWGPDSVQVASSACHPPDGSFSTFHDGPQLSTALAATTHPGPQQPPVGTSQGQESTM
uniref:von Willebrand factor C and EGF domains n=1 Tax=Nomascus leucogenys TaxID=61853 RepID=A0A2I3HPM3_NOMLE